VPTNACVGCHFFIRERRIQGHDEPMTNHVSSPERVKARNGDYSWIPPDASLACSRGVWDEGYNFDRAKRHEIIVEMERKDFCFFLEFHPGMLLPAGAELQKRREELREAGRDRRLSLLGLWIAASALAVNAVLGIIRLCLGR
jgi:hypothetical protein